MKVVVVGAGAVGSYLAERLSEDKIDVVVVEADPVIAAQLQEKLDVLVITGNGASPSVLEEAGADRADLLIAVSNTDGVNILACITASELGTGRTVARIEDPEISSTVKRMEGVDEVIDPSETAAKELLRLINRSGASEIIPFAEHRLTMVGGNVTSKSSLLSGPLSSLRLLDTETEWVVTAIVRHGETIVAHGDTQVEAGDHVLLMVKTDDISFAIDLLGLEERQINRVVVMGSTRLAELSIELFLEQGYKVTVIEEDRARCQHLANRFADALIQCGDPTDLSLLKELDLNGSDAVLALTGWDPVNLLGGLLGKSLGAATAIARFTHIEYVGILEEATGGEGAGIDATVSGRLTAAAEILRFVGTGRIYVATFSDTEAEAIELEVAQNSPAAGKRVVDIGFPRNAIIGGLVRNGSTVVPSGDSIIDAGDRVIFFALPEAIPQVERILTHS